jgi:phage terminase large subunit-like protein
LDRSAIPRFAVPASSRPSHAPALEATAAKLGITLLPWQQQVARVALEHAGGKLVYRDVVVSVPRQSGKTTLILVVVVHRMLASPRQRLVYGAQTRLAARGKLFDTWWPLLRASPLGELFTLTKATGAEALRCRNGSILTLLSTEEAAGHGETLDLAVLDEAWALTAAAEQSVRPAMVTRRNGQMWILSTAGTERSTYWRSKVAAGRTQAATGLDGMAYFEWSAGEDVDVTDPTAWATWMPALGHTVEQDTIGADLASMPLPEWRRAYANQWPDESLEGWRVIGRDLWEASRL